MVLLQLTVLPPAYLDSPRASHTHTTQVFPNLIPSSLTDSSQTYESDMSIGRQDAYINVRIAPRETCSNTNSFQNDDAHSLDISRFARAYATGMKHDRYTLDGLAQDFTAKAKTSEDMNPYFFSAPFSGVLVAPAAYFFVINMMSNHTAEETNGYLDGETFKQFFAVKGHYPNFEWMPGQERIPDNWYRRPTLSPYDIPNADSDLAVQYSAYPESFRLGGNVNGINTYMGVSLEDLTGGVMTAEMLFNPMNPRAACFYAQLAQSLIPDSAKLPLKGLAGALDPVVSAVSGLVNSAIKPLMVNLECPIVEKFDQTL